MFKRCSLTAILLFSLTLLVFSAASSQVLKPRYYPEKPVKTTIPEGYDRQHIEVKFIDNLDIGLSEQGAPISRTGFDLKSSDASDIMISIDNAGGIWSRLTGDTESKTDELREKAQQNLGVEIADMNNYFYLTVPEGVTAEEWIDRLNTLDEIELARPIPMAMPAPLPGDFEPQQGYLDPAFTGIDAEYAWTITGGTGTYSKIYDFEYSWNLAHQDLPSGQITTHIPIPYIAVDPFPVTPGDNHGTAVLGELVSVSNGWGTTGASHGSWIGLCPTWLKTTVPGSTPSWQLVVAMSNALTNTFIQGGDVFLIEQQVAGPNWTASTGDTGLVPVDWDLTVYNQVLTAVGNGIHVVECAANGYQNLDDPVYNTGHAPFLVQNHSGAIIVGAGGTGGSWADRSRTTFSNYGMRLDLQGWGEQVVTTGYGDKYSEGTADSSLYYTDVFSGTSSAAPNIASAVAIVSSINEIYNGILNPISPNEMRNLLRTTGSQQQGGLHFPWEFIGPRPNLKAAINISGITDTLYYKPSYIDYCPNGMPDFSCTQDTLWRGYTRWTYDGPTALANCLWWYDSKFEPTPVDPRPFGGATNDNYPLVTAYGAWDDHDSANVKPLIEAIAACTGTDDTTGLPGVYDEYGTFIYEMEDCANTWITSAGLHDSFSVRTIACPEFDTLAEELHESQNIILLLAFYAATDTDPSQCTRIGGHYVNMVGVDDTKKRIAIADPNIGWKTGLSFTDDHPYTHNNASEVSYEVFQAAQMTSATCIVMDGCWYLTDYYPEWAAIAYEKLNGGIWGYPSYPYTHYAIIEHALIICPTTDPPPIDTCEVYKSSYEDYAPSGMPDFDQKQDNWKHGGGLWNWCGPVALANCIWWFDSKYETSPVDPRPFYPSGTPNDNYPLLSSYGAWDDHDSANVVPFIQALKPYCFTNVFEPGTVMADMEKGFNDWATAAGVDDDYETELIPGPDFARISSEVAASNDVILLLGFYEPGHSSGEARLGGHYVTVAGYCTEATDICISDPYFDINEGEPPAGIAHLSEVHNNAEFVSGPHGTNHHDRYNVWPVTHSCPTPATSSISYTTNWTYLGNFAMQNTFDLMLSPMPYEGSPLVVLIDYALVIRPVTDNCCLDWGIPGDEDKSGGVNLTDILDAISYVYVLPLGEPQAADGCNALYDVNGDGTTADNPNVNLTDILDMISHVYVVPLGEPVLCCPPGCMTP